MRTRIISGLLGILLVLGVVGMPGSVMALDLDRVSEYGDALIDPTETIEQLYTTLPPWTTDTINEMTAEQCAFGLTILESQGHSAPTVKEYGFEYDPLTGPCKEFRDTLQHTLYGGEDVPYLEECRPINGLTYCVALGHYACDFALFAGNGLVYICMGGITPYN